MINVIEFKKPAEKDPHGAGMAICIGCKHEWAAVAPIAVGKCYSLMSYELRSKLA